jgi:hypothetical protein
VPKMVVVSFRATNALKLARWQRSDHFGREEPGVFSAGSTSTKPPSNGSDSACRLYLEPKRRCFDYTVNRTIPGFCQVGSKSTRAKTVLAMVLGEVRDASSSTTA